MYISLKCDLHKNYFEKYLIINNMPVIDDGHVRFEQLYKYLLVGF